MTRTELNEAVKAFKKETQEALETVYTALNAGQKKQLIKDEAVKSLFDRFKVAYESEE